MPKRRYMIPVEVVPAEAGCERFILAATKNGKACLVVAPEMVTPDGRIEVCPIKRDREYVLANPLVAHIPSGESRLLRDWIQDEIPADSPPGSAGTGEGGYGVPGPDEDSQDRAFPRIPVASLVVSGSRCSIGDISMGGIRLHQDLALPPGERRCLTLTDILAGETRQLEAEVVWCRHGRTGLRWVDLDDEHRTWLRSYVHTSAFEETAGPPRAWGRWGEAVGT